MRKSVAENTRVSRLKSIAEKLFSSNHPAELREAATEFYRLLSGITRISDDSDCRADAEAIFLDAGKAISPNDAARCVLDYARTVKFLRGIEAALREAQRRFPNQTIEILYAGCGPFATLAVPLAARFGANEIRFTLLDVHARSLESTRSIFETFGLQNLVREYVQADAATYVCRTAPHIIVSETMQKALEKEPQAAIMLNLAPQLRRNGILIPEQISVDAYLYAPRKELSMMSAASDEREVSEDAFQTERVRIHLGRLLEINRGASFEISEDGRLPIIALDVPPDADKNLKLMLSTTVKIFETVVLEEYESAITTPLALRHFDWNGCGNRIEFTYSLGSFPGFKCQCGE